MKRKTPRILSRKPSAWIVLAYFLILAGIGYMGVDDYGITYDEMIQRQHGMVTMDYLNAQTGEPFYKGKLSPQHNLENYEYGFHGVLFSTLALQFDILFRLRDFRSVFLARRICILTVFLLGLFFLFKLTSYTLKNKWLGLLACTVLFFTPRFFAHAHFNPKDPILLTGYIMAAYTMIRFLDKPGWRWALLHGLACGVAMNTRMLAMAIPVMTIGWFLLDRVFLKKERIPLKTSLVSMGVFIPVTVFFTVLLWPYLWFDPIGRFAAIFSELSQFHWNSAMLFFGEAILPDDLPTFYIPLWIMITIPPVYLVFIIIGIVLVLARLLKDLKRKRLYGSPAQRTRLAILGLFIVPVFIVILLKSHIYNGWRHMYFVYPPMVLLAVYAFDQLLRKYANYKLLKVGIPALLAIGICSSVFTIWRSHPLQATYFNILAGDNIDQRFDIDYWGTSLLVLYNKVLERSNKEVIKINWAPWNTPADHTRLFLPPEKSKRLQPVNDIRQADYYITLNMWGDFGKKKANVYPMNQPSIKVKNGNILLSAAHRLTPEW